MERNISVRLYDQLNCCSEIALSEKSPCEGGRVGQANKGSLLVIERRHLSTTTKIRIAYGKRTLTAWHASKHKVR